MNYHQKTGKFRSWVVRFHNCSDRNFTSPHFSGLRNFTNRTLTLRRGIEDALAIEPRRLAARCLSLSLLYDRCGHVSSDGPGTSTPTPEFPIWRTANRRQCLSSSSVNTTILFTYATLWYALRLQRRNTRPRTNDRPPQRCEQHWALTTFSVCLQFALLLPPACYTDPQSSLLYRLSRSFIQQRKYLWSLRLYYVWSISVSCSAKHKVFTWVTIQPPPFFL